MGMIEDAITEQGQTTSYPAEIQALLNIIKTPGISASMRKAAVEEYNAWNEADLTNKRKVAEVNASNAKPKTVVIDINSQEAAMVLAEYMAGKAVRIDIPYQNQHPIRWGVQILDAVLDAPETLRFLLQTNKASADAEIGKWFGGRWEAPWNGKTIQQYFGA